MDSLSEVDLKALFEKFVKEELRKKADKETNASVDSASEQPVPPVNNGPSRLQDIGSEAALTVQDDEDIEVYFTKSKKGGGGVKQKRLQFLVSVKLVFDTPL